MVPLQHHGQLRMSESYAYMRANAIDSKLISDLKGSTKVYIYFSFPRRLSEEEGYVLLGLLTPI